MFFALLVSAYFNYVRAENLNVFAKLALALVAYILLTGAGGFLAGFIVYLGTHTEPKGSVLGPREVAIGCGLLVVYVAVGWLLCSFIVGRFIWPSRTL